MTGAAELYRARLLANEELIAKIQPGDTLALGTWMGQPHGFMLSLTRFGANIAPLYVITAPASGAGELLNQPNIICFSSFLGPYERAARRDQHNVFYTPTHFSDGYQAVRTNLPPNFLIIRAAPMDERGFINLSLASSWINDAMR